MSRVVVGLSGGVDSAVCAQLLLEQGHDVEALFMKNWEEDDDKEYCAATVDLRDAQQVADTLGIHLHTVNFATEYWDRVFELFLTEYRAGRTPNPDILCNKEIKFRAFLEHAHDLGADAIATGHYVRSDYKDGYHRLLKGKDNNKDQSYFLYTLGQQQLGASLFPLGEMEKSEVREIAKASGFDNHAKKDSTGICFIGERRFKDFLERFIPAQPGEIINSDGEIIGEHSGLMFYTLGQRKGIGIGGRADSADEAWYVVNKDMKNNRLIVGQGGNHPLLLSSWLTMGQAHWTRRIDPQLPLQCRAKVRYRQTDQACTISRHENGLWHIEFEQAQRAVTPGQSIVFYQDDECLGGGIIEATEHWTR